MISRAERAKKRRTQSVLGASSQKEGDLLRSFLPAYAIRIGRVPREKQTPFRAG